MYMYSILHGQKKKASPEARGGLARTLWPLCPAFVGFVLKELKHKDHKEFARRSRGR